MGLQALIRAAHEYDVVQEERFFGLRVEKKKKKTTNKNANAMPSLLKLNFFFFCKMTIKNVIVYEGLILF